MERGRTFARLGKDREMEAMASFDEAEKLLSDPTAKGLAIVQQAILFARAGNKECLEVCNRVVAAESPAAPLALIVSGVFELPTRPSPALDALRNGLSQIRRPRLLDEVDFPWAYDALFAAAARETEADRLPRFAAVFAELGRLQPLSTRVGFDHAAILLRARRFEDAANRLLSIENSDRSLREAAEACAAGGLHLRAASLYRAWFDLQPGSNAAGLFHRAASLKKAGDVAGAMAGFEEYLAKAGPSGKLAGRALLEKAALQPAEEAVPTYDRVLKAREVTTSPAQDDWAQALLGRGRALTRLSRTAEARKALTEYLERYGEGSAPRPSSIEASWLLVQVSIQERRWKAGLAQLRDLDTRSARVAEADRAPYTELLKEARFVEGDLHLNLDDYASAFQAFGEAVRRHADSEDRLWGLIGRARALARLERKEEARKDYSNARALFEEEKSLAGRGRDYWEIALEALAREVQ
jgi:tetratricopeptide (TPR) repeat protein